eukprot:1778720-Prymnesium_polylepis.1
MVLFAGLWKGFSEVADLLLVPQAGNLVLILVEIPHRVVVVLAVFFLIGRRWCQQLHACCRTCGLGSLTRLEEARGAVVGRHAGRQRRIPETLLVVAAGPAA